MVPIGSALFIRGRACFSLLARALAGAHYLDSTTAYLYLPREIGARAARTEDGGPKLRVDYDASGEPIGIQVTAPLAVTSFFADLAARNAAFADLASLADADVALKVQNSGRPFGRTRHRSTSSFSLRRSNRPNSVSRSHER
jgi:hypothetical protein